MKKTSPPRFDLLLAILIADGPTELEVEYDDHEWWVSVVEGDTSVGVARYSTESERNDVDATLVRLRKDKRISVNGKMHRLSFRSQDNFGEPSWRVRVTQMK